MQMSYGPFTSYIPTDASHKPMIDAGVIFAQDPSREDWYALSKTLTGTVALVKSGRVVSVTQDATSLPLPVGGTVVATDLPVVIGWAWDGATLAPYVPPLADAITSKVATAWALCQSKCEAGSVNVTTSAGAYVYGLDANSRTNIANTMIGVLAGVTPLPRPWTPKGASAPISVTRDDLNQIAGRIGAGYDALMQAYLVHKGHIRALTDVASVTAYDLTTGWP